MMRMRHLIHIVSFLAFLYTGMFLNVAFGGTGSVDETENRALAPFPVWSGTALLSGTYLQALENYLADHVAFRDRLVRASKLLTSWRGLAGSDATQIVASAANNDAQSSGQTVPEAGPDIEAAPSQPLPLPPSASPGPASKAAKPRRQEEGRVIGKVLLTGDRAMFLYSYNPAAGKAYAGVINAFQKQVARRFADPVHVSVLLAPSAIEFVENPALKGLSASQEKAIAAVYEQIDPPVTKVEAVPFLREHAAEEVFFRTDHHWTATGAYYAYQAFMNARGLTPLPLSRYETEKVPGFLGSLYSATLNKKLAAHPDTIVLYKPFMQHEYVVYYQGPLKMKLLDKYHADKKNKYRIFLSGDRPWGKITTDAAYDRRIAVIKDSYGNAFIPFLLPHFKEIYVIDPRQFHQPLYDFIEKHRIDEVLFITNMTITTSDGFTRLIYKLMDGDAKQPQ
ncbi:DHHW family protein [Brevibacillus sp. B_LB10_24]|uniref:DHHW family protein n=1 Tax=Brevibacillus sp. B_LB10_24 TaxID=3380645 RepID=UPI0038B985FD